MIDLNDLVEKLHQMRVQGARSSPERTVLHMHLFGCIFDDDIEAAGTNPRELERHYRIRYANVDVRTERAGRAISKTAVRTGPIATAVRAGRNLKEVMTVNPEVERRWRRPERE